MIALDFSTKRVDNTNTRLSSQLERNPGKYPDLVSDVIFCACSVFCTQIVVVKFENYEDYLEIKSAINRAW